MKIEQKYRRPVYNILSGDSGGLTLQILFGGLDWFFGSQQH